ncbi:hypothetical protein F1D05_30045 [Kribbella qitaiheensis]|uniref:Mercury transporter n=1 Tax=Kribbella qitaiheensis TaxID=1544730 RepID=A0A7G6XAG7_9ACTN|nr:hypothetical protein F1D05_30045 [Kribbella qitaiheensis]
MCCAGPLLAVLGGLGAASLVGAVFWPVLGLVAVTAAVGVVWIMRRRHRPAACTTEAGPADLGMPSTAAKPRSGRSEARS